MLVRVVSGMQHRVQSFYIICQFGVNSLYELLFPASGFILPCRVNIDLLNSFSGVLEGERFSCILVITL